MQVTIAAVHSCRPGQSERCIIMFGSLSLSISLPELL